MRPETTGTPTDPETDRYDRDLFGHRLCALLTAVGVSPVYDADAFALRVEASGGVSWLGNRYDEYVRAAEDEREGILLHFAQGIVDAMRTSPVAEDLAGAREHLRPRIRQRGHVAVLGLQMRADGVEGRRLFQNFVQVTDDLGVEIVFDTPANIVSLPGEQLREWGLTPEDALQIAVENLRASAPDPFQPIGDGAWIAAVGDCYDSARLLLEDQIRSLPVVGDPVALPANRDTLVITGEHATGGLYRLLQIAVAASDRPRMDTLQPIVLRKEGWVDWMPPVDHPMREAFYELAIRTRGSSYAELQTLLEQQNERDGTDLFVATYGVFRLAEGQLAWSHAVWPPVRGLLPEADLVSVMHPEEPRFIVVPRARLIDLAGHLLDRVPELHPPYHAFDAAPDTSLWDRLRRYAIQEGDMPPGRAISDGR